MVLLVPSRTDVWWYQNYVLHRAEVRFIRGRLRFIGPGAIANAPFPSALVIYRGPEEKAQKPKTNIQQITIGELLDGIDQGHGDPI